MQVWHSPHIFMFMLPAISASGITLNTGPSELRSDILTEPTISHQKVSALCLPCVQDLRIEHEFRRPESGSLQLAARSA